MTNTWLIDEYMPSDGAIVAGGMTDHRATLKRSGDGETVFTLVQASARGFPEPEFRAMLVAMIAGLGHLEDVT